MKESRINEGQVFELVALHPEAVEGRPDELRWLLPAETFSFVGDVERVPTAVGELLTDGTLAELRIEPNAIWTKLGEGRNWRAEGARVRTALQNGAAVTAEWVSAGETSSDDVLEAAVREVIDGQVGDYVRSHGGSLELLNVVDGAVRVRLAGACAHCPASEVTLTTRFEKAVRAKCPSVRQITAVTGQPAASADAKPGRRWLKLLPR